MHLVIQYPCYKVMRKINYSRSAVFINFSQNPLPAKTVAIIAIILRLIITVVNPIITISIAISISASAIAEKKSMMIDFVNLEISE
jgi:hypothetical protein